MPPIENTGWDPATRTFGRRAAALLKGLIAGVLPVDFG